MTLKVLGRALCALAALVFAPVAAFAQTAETTLPRGFYEPSGRQQTPVLPYAVVGRDSISGNMCLVGVTTTCVLPGTGGGGGGGGGAVTVADGADAAQGARADAACGTDNGTCTILALLKRQNQRLTALETILNTPASSLPPQAPVASSDTTVSYLYSAITASGDTTLVSPTAGQSTRVQYLYCSVLPTSGAVTVTLKSASTTLAAEDRPSTGGVIEWRYAPLWHVKTANNEALVINFSTAGAYKCRVWYVKGA